MKAILNSKHPHRAISGREYELVLGLKSRKAGGVYYTPSKVVDYMVRATLSPLITRASSAADLLGLRVCDPACGAGYFLSRARDLIVESGVSRFGKRAAAFRRQVERQCLFGFDLDERALSIAREAIPEANLERIDSLRGLSWRFNSSFDAVIGNPPYGLRDSGAESTRAFIKLALDLLKEDGRHSFIVPKSLLYSSVWASTLETLFAGLVEIVDCGRAWPEVKLEQLIYVMDGNGLPAPRVYRSGRLESDGAVRQLGALDKSSIDEFGVLLNGISADELELARRMNASGHWLGEFLENRRGGPLQAQLEVRPGRSRVPVFGGKQLSRYGELGEPKGYVSKAVATKSSRFAIQPGALLAQNIVAHVRHPHEHLKIVATLSTGGKSGPCLALDTINLLRNRSSIDPAFFLALLNSKLIAWYVHRFIVGRAVRTIHFDDRVTARIPVPVLAGNSKRVRALAAAARKMLENPSLKLDSEIDSLVCDLFGLSGEGMARAGRGLGVWGLGVPPSP